MKTKTSLSSMGLVKPAGSHNKVIAQSPENVVAQLRDDEIPSAEPPVRPALDPVPEAVPTKATVGPARRRGSRPAKVETVDTTELAHRSLYARPETLDLIRDIAHRERVSAQSLYRRGLLLMLRERGFYADKTDDDV